MSKKIKTPVTSEEEKRLIGHKLKLKKRKGLKKINVYFNKKNNNGQTKYVSGTFYSKKNKDKYTYRSSYELKCFLELEQDSNVVSYLSESLSIPYRDSCNRDRLYIPDILILFSDGSMCVWEIKPEEMLKDADVQAKARACQLFLKGNYPDRNIDYKFITEKKLFSSIKEYTDFLNSIKRKDFSKKNAHSFYSETL